MDSPLAVQFLSAWLKRLTKKMHRKSCEGFKNRDQCLTRKVRVVRFVTKHTVEERVAELQRKKTAMITAAIEQHITKHDIDELFRDPILN